MFTAVLCLLSLLQIRTRGAEIALCSAYDWLSHIRAPLAIATALAASQHHVTFIGPESARPLVDKYPLLDMRSIGDLDQSWRYLARVDELMKGQINFLDMVIDGTLPTALGARQWKTCLH